jgi:hypothetical protein
VRRFVSAFPLNTNSKHRSTQLQLSRQTLKETMSLLQSNPWFSAAPLDPDITDRKYVSKPILDFLRLTSPLPAAFDPKTRMSPPIFSTRVKEKPQGYLTRDSVHNMLTRATMDDDIDMDAENMAIATGGWRKWDLFQTNGYWPATSYCSNRIQLDTALEN